MRIVSLLIIFGASALANVPYSFQVGDRLRLEVQSEDALPADVALPALKSGEVCRVTDRTEGVVEERQLEKVHGMRVESYVVQFPACRAKLSQPLNNGQMRFIVELGPALRVLLDHF